MELPLIFTVRLDMNEEVVEEGNQWFNTRHLWDLLSAGFLSGARFRSLKGNPEYMHIYELPNADILTSKALTTVIKNDPLEPTMVQSFHNLSSSLYDQIVTENLPKTPYSLPKPRTNPLGGIKSKYVITIRMNVATEVEEELVRWYKEEHIPLMLEAEGFANARLCRQSSNQPEYPNLEPKWISIWELDSPDAIRDPKVKAANETDWCKRLHAFTTDVSMNVMERIFPA